MTWFEEELARIKAHIADQHLKIVQGAGGRRPCAKGDPHVVLAIEGASILDEALGQLQAAYDMGIRHIQLVHYIRNTVGDFQTERPEHSGLTELGQDGGAGVQSAGHPCRPRAQHAPTAVTQALAVSKVAMVWSHSSVTRTRKPEWTMPVHRRGS